MRLGLKIFLCYLVIFILCFSYPAWWMYTNLRTRYLEGVEDPLVDMAYIFSGYVATEMEEGVYNPALLNQALSRAYEKKLGVQIYDLEKEFVDLHIYITDIKGIVLLDTRYPDNTGQDFSKWRNVYLTLQGKYGARSSPSPVDGISVLHVSAPVLVNGRLVGTLTVAKPVNNIEKFLGVAKPHLLRVSLLALALTAVLGFAVSLWLTRPIKELTHYSRQVARKERADQPELDNTEVGELGRSLFVMQKALEGKQYIENYVQTLTHELKSPMSAIQAAAEILLEDPPREKQKQFLQHILVESKRTHHIVERLLELSALESCQKLENTVPVDFTAIVKGAVESKKALLSLKHLTIDFVPTGPVWVNGEQFLLQQAVANLLQNALDFSREYGRITVSLATEGKEAVLVVENEGPLLPDYAKSRIFERFFSLPRPGGERKSTGLGLNLVKEVALLHYGDIHLTNHTKDKVRAVFTLPCCRLSKEG